MIQGRDILDICPAFILSDEDKKIRDLRGDSKILIVGRYYPRVSGQSTFTANISEGLTFIGHDVTVYTHSWERSIDLCFLQRNPSDIVKLLGSKVKAKTFSSYLSSPKIHENFEGLSLLEEILVEDYELIIATAGVPYGVLVDTFTKILSGESAIIFQGSDFYRNCNSNFKDGIMGYYYFKRTKPSRVFAISEIIQKDIMETLGIKAKIVYPPINHVTVGEKEAFKIAEEYGIQEKPLVFFGRLSEEKGIEILNELSKKWFVVVIGTGKTPSIENGLIFTKLLPGQQFHILAACRVQGGTFLYLGKETLYFKETFCMAAAEAAALKVGGLHGYPIIALDNPALRVSVPYSTFFKEYSEILKALKNRKDDSIEIQRNHEHVRSKFSVEKTISNLIKHLTDK